jgi:hypothetical protein
MESWRGVWAMRLGRETTLTSRQIAQRLHMGSWKSLNNKLYLAAKASNQRKMNVKRLGSEKLWAYTPGPSPWGCRGLTLPLPTPPRTSCLEAISEADPFTASRLAKSWRGKIMKTRDGD